MTGRALRSRRRPILALALGAAAFALGCASGGAPGPGQPAPSAPPGEPAERRSSFAAADDGHLLVVLREPLERPAAQIVERLARRHRLIPRASWPMKSLGRECVVFDVLSGRVDDTLLRRVQDDPAVEMAQVNAIFQVRVQPGAGDPHADLQHARRVLRLDAALGRATGRGVRVGVVDTGAELDHPDLRGQVAEAKNFVRDSATFATDRHGTAVAGVIAAARGNGVGIVGVAPDARLHLLKACWYPRHRARARNDDDAEPAVCSSYTLALALDHAVDARYDVVNLSLGGPEDPLLERIVESGVERDMVFVAPAPERADDAFLAGSRAVLRVAPMHNERAAPSRDDLGDVLVAPGAEVLTTVPGGGFDFVGGSSIATAHVAGVVALLLEDRATPTAGLGDLLRRTARSLGGERVVDACAALAARDAGMLAPGGSYGAFTLDCLSEEAEEATGDGAPARDSSRPRF